MTDERTDLERARTAWEAGLNQEMLRHILNHLEQQSAPPEAAPERATAYPALKGTSLDDVCARLECGLTRREHTNTMHRFVDLSPSAVQGEERTAVIDAANKMLREFFDAVEAGQMLIEDLPIDLRRRLRAVLMKPPASSSPTATAQRGEEPRRCIRCGAEEVTKGQTSGWCRTGPSHDFGDPLPSYEEAAWTGSVAPDPLPAQTEPGERRCKQCDATIPGQYRFCISCGALNPIQLAPTPPSPAPECAHEEALNAIRLEAYRRNSPDRLTLRLVQQMLDEALAPSLPTEGEG